MTPRELTNTLTALDPSGLASAIPVAWRELMGEPPTRAAVLCLVAQIRHETGLLSCHNWNLGNLKSIPGDGRSWQYFRCYELEQGVKVWYDPPHPATRFRAYDSLEESMIDFLSVLRRRYASAWPYVVSGDPSRFCRALKARGYFTDTEEVYEHDVVSAFKRFDATLTFDLNPPIDGDLAARAAALRDQNITELTSAVTLPPPPDDDHGMVLPEDRPTRPTGPDGDPVA